MAIKADKIDKIGKVDKVDRAEEFKVEADKSEVPDNVEAENVAGLDVKSANVDSSMSKHHKNVIEAEVNENEEFKVNEIKAKFKYKLELEDPVKMLVEMAKKGEIDPWNIDVVEVADKFLSELEKAKKLDLRISGRVLLYAAILVRMKAEILAEEAIFDEESVEEIDFNSAEFTDFEFENEFDSLDSGLELSELEVNEVECGSVGEISEEDEVISYLLSPYRKVRRFTTLKDLINELKKAEKVKRKRKRRVDKGEILKVPHEEEIEETVLKIGKRIEEMLEKKERLSFFSVVAGLDLPEVLSYYISILYLSFRGEIDIEQKKLFEDDIIIFKS